MQLALVRGIVGVLLLLGADSCYFGMSPVDLETALLWDDEKTIEFFLDCASDTETVVESSEESVVVGIQINRASGDCGTGELVTLTEPLGDRVLIDKFDGEPISVHTE